MAKKSKVKKTLVDQILDKAKLTMTASLQWVRR